MKESEARLLLKKYREGTISEKERSFLESWYLDLAHSKSSLAEASEPEVLAHQLDHLLPPVVAEKEKPVRKLFSRLGVAAAVLVGLMIGYGLYTKEEAGGSEAEAVAFEDALPGDNRAKLTLANGESIFLDGASRGKLAEEGEVSIIKTGEGEIVYRFAANSAVSRKAAEYNKIETPKAGQYKVILPDGTNAWLNAASSIEFPTMFDPEQRIVEVTGEVYFEVAKLEKDKRAIPFRVFCGGQTIEVLSTIFNVNSYPEEEAIRTTLIEGSIGVKSRDKKGSDVILKPGQQAQLARKKADAATSASDFDVKQVETEAIVAWKEGYFRFDEVSLPELMRQVSRWYDMQVVYEGAISDYAFVGQIERSANLSKVLRILELGGVKFRVEERKIIVME